VSAPDLIAVNSDEPMETVAAKVGAVLGLALAPRDSSFWGPYYSGWPESEVKVTENRDLMFTEGDPPDEQWFTANARDARYLVWEASIDQAVLDGLRAAGLDVRLVART
jgi:hypothetical protein